MAQQQHTSVHNNECSATLIFRCSTGIQVTVAAAYEAAATWRRVKAPGWGLPTQQLACKQLKTPRIDHACTQRFISGCGICISSRFSKQKERKKVDKRLYSFLRTLPCLTESWRQGSPPSCCHQSQPTPRAAQSCAWYVYIFMHIVHGRWGSVG